MVDAAPTQHGRTILTDGTYETVKALVMDHLVPPDTRVNIYKLARDLHVSQTPVREALARLESDGLVLKEPLRGYRTTRLLTTREFDELFEMRRLIEPWAAEVATRNVTAKGRKNLRAEMSRSGDAPATNDYQAYKSLAEHDARFHGLIFELAGNAAIREMWTRTHCHLHLFRLYYSLEPGAEG